jgi:division protein CdvB (Snf7/Vps24/ESCRT-III family)
MYQWGVTTNQNLLKPRMQFAIRRIELQKQKLEQATERFKQRDKAIFARIVDAFTKHDQARANVFSNELAELRKMSKLIINSQKTIDYVNTRLNEAANKTLGDVVTALATSVLLLKGVRQSLVSVFPEAENELGELGNVLSGILVEVCQSSAAVLDFNIINEAAGKTLSEVAAATEQTMKDLYPALPI